MSRTITGRKLPGFGPGWALHGQYVRVYLYNHPEVDREYGEYKACIGFLSKMMLYLLQVGCIHVYIYIHTYVCIYIPVIEP